MSTTVTPNGKPKRKRQRKRRAASLSSLSSSSSEGSADESSAKPAAVTDGPAESESSGEESTASSATLSDSSEDESERSVPAAVIAQDPARAERAKRGYSLSPPRSPSPPYWGTGLDRDGHPLLWGHVPGDVDREAKDLTEQEKKDQADYLRLREFYMTELVTRFGNELDTIRKEPDLTESRLRTMITSLASGVDLFTSDSPKSGGAWRSSTSEWPSDRAVLLHALDERDAAATQKAADEAMQQD
ncbi:uncharacterized protein L969DRAFT_95580 [Mixia osmundae IAM 14324]|uniref:Ribosome assembly protein 3 n=1 Tax=Mixia osmundae (strain CBS 9802 / IAM 14324 / JCM 22182 / KY 12970) TaxID=764103 RepID=G7E7U2_MIXOS|nr:uncharacterized protein L969DRAFT_95580 [Mixia osmundae IAM 14324]KEI38503.1 hypothetical protein L969DRAFT_95580 [Mixia osmundae IAM 14324]GAA98902.1 hypothetical protein E5Q_05590 [Mixia osmundae IAM 14324]